MPRRDRVVMGVVGVVCACHVHCGVARGEAEARFVVRDRVAVGSPARIGLNVHMPSEFKHFKGSGKVNLWSRGGHPEGFVTVVKGVATGGGGDYLENRERPWASFWDTYRDGFFDGADMRIYRYGEDGARLLRTAKVVGFEGGRGESANRFDFGVAGPAVRAGDEYVVWRRSLLSGPGLRVGKEGTDDGNGLLSGFFAPAPDGVRVALDDTTRAPEGGGRASLRVDLPVAGRVGVSKWYVVPQGPGWVRFDPASTFRFSGWFKQAAGGRGELTVRCGNLGSKTVGLGSEWELVEFDFAGGEADGERSGLEFALSGPGTLWIDNFAVYEVGEGVPGLLEPYPDMVGALRDFRPGFIRIWQLQNNKGSVPPLETLLEGYFAQPWIFDARRMETFNQTGLGPMLALCEDVGAEPWIIVSTFFGEEDWAKLVEYLAGPADSPMGSIRARGGRAEPWTDAFETIRLECGNETWNGVFRPQNFPRRPMDYARYADLLFAAARESPHFVDGKFEFIANGATNSLDGFTLDVAVTSEHADRVDIGNYIGGWEAGSTDTGAGGEAAYQSRLLYGVTHGRDIVKNFAATLERATERRGRPVRGGVYEAGPGYSLPGPGVEVDWDEQRLGKSLASAIGTLDQYFNHTLSGVDLIGHFAFGRGLYWYTHADTTDAWRPHAVTLACGLRNEHGSGDLLVVESVATPTVDLPARTLVRKRNDGSLREIEEPARDAVPLTGCHVFRDGDRFSVFLLSRRMAGDTTVAVELPWDAVGPFALHRLTGDSAMAHNIDREEVAIRSREDVEIDWGALTLPPHSVTVITGGIAR